MVWIHGVKKFGIKNVNMAGCIGGWDSAGNNRGENAGGALKNAEERATLELLLSCSWVALETPRHPHASVTGAT